MAGSRPSQGDHCVHWWKSLISACTRAGSASMWVSRTTVNSAMGGTLDPAFG